MIIKITCAFLACACVANAVPLSKSHSVDWLHLISKRSPGKDSVDTPLAANNKSEEKTTKLDDEKFVVQNVDDDGESSENAERTIDWHLLDGDSNDLNQELQLRRRRRSVKRSSVVNRQRSRRRTASANHRQSVKSRQGKNSFGRYRSKRALYSDDEEQRISDADLEKLAFLVAELQQLNDEEVGRSGETEELEYPAVDDFYPQQAQTTYGELSPSDLTEDELALLAQIWRVQQRKLDRSLLKGKRSSGDYYPVRAYDEDRYERPSIPVKVILVDPSDLENVDDESWRRQNAYEYIPYQSTLDDDGDDDEESLLAAPSTSYYSYNTGGRRPYDDGGDDDVERLADEVELEKRIVSLARYLSRRSVRR